MAAVVLALFAGVLTIAAPCTLPVLPAMLGASLGRSDKARPAFIALGFVGSFAAAAVFFSVTTQVAGIDQTVLRAVAAVLLAARGNAVAASLRMDLDTGRRTSHSRRRYRSGICPG